MSKYQIVENKFKYSDTYYTIQVTITFRGFFCIKEKYVKTLTDYSKVSQPILKFKSIDEAKEYIKRLEDKPIKTIVY